MTTPQGPEDRDNKPADSSGSSDHSGTHKSPNGSSDNLSGNSGASSQPNPYANYDSDQAANNFGSNGDSSSYGSPEGSSNDAQTTASNAFTGGNGGFDQTAYQNGYNGGGYDQNANSHNATSAYNQAYNQPYNQAYDQSSFGAYPAGQQTQAQHGSNQDSFFKSLFDFSFTKYVTPSVVKVIYALLFVLVALISIVGLFLILASLTQDGGIFVFIVGLPVIIVGAVVTLAFYRVGLEVAVSLIRTSQSVQSIDQRQAQQEQQDTSGYTYGG